MAEETFAELIARVRAGDEQAAARVSIAGTASSDFSTKRREYRAS